MTGTKLFAAVAALLIAGPAFAQEPRYYRSYDPNYDPYYRTYEPGFWPGEVAGDIVGGAIGTAGAIATAPFRSPREAYAMGGGPEYCAQRYRSYDPASGTFMGYDGLRHRCP